MSFRIIWKKIATIATLATNQEPTLTWDSIQASHLADFCHGGVIGI